MIYSSNKTYCDIEKPKYDIPFFNIWQIILGIRRMKSILKPGLTLSNNNIDYKIDYFIKKNVVNNMCLL